MATRFYLPSSGTAPLTSLAVRSDWEQSTGLVRLPCFTAKQNTALSTSQRTWPSTATQQWVWYQFQSEQLLSAYSWTTADTVSMVIGKMAETTANGDTHLAYIVRVVSSDGATERGVVGLYHATSTEVALIASAATRIHSARTNGATSFSSQIGDRIIIEIGMHGVTPAAEIVQMRIGDPSATADFALTAALTTDLCSWVELSRTVSLGVPATNITPDETFSAFADEPPTVTQTHNITATETATGLTNDLPTLNQTHNFAPDESFTSHSAESPNVVIDTTVQILPAESSHSATADNSALTQTHLLTVNECSHSATADNLSISQVHNFAPDECITAFAADFSVITQMHNFAPSECASAVLSDIPQLWQVHNLTASDGVITLTSDNTTTSQVLTIIVYPDESINGHFADIPALSQIHQITATDTATAQTIESPEIGQNHLISALDTVNQLSSDIPTIGQVHMITAENCIEQLTSDIALLSTTEILTILVVLNWVNSVNVTLLREHKSKELLHDEKITVDLHTTINT